MPEGSRLPAAILVVVATSLAASLVLRRRRRLNFDNPWPWLYRIWGGGSCGSGSARMCQPVRDIGGYEGLIGNTPMVKLHSLSAATSTGCEILVKVEFLNPGGTSKDRIAASMIREAEATGKLKQGGTVVEGTSGSTGICLASLCRAKGYRCVIVMPDDQAAEKAELLRTFGAEVVKVRTASIANPEHYINVAARLAKERPGHVFMDQFETEANLKAHLAHTGPEIWQQTGGRLDAFVMGAGTGGCLAGVSLFLRGEKSSAKIFLVDPPGSALFSRVRYGVCYSPQMSERDVRKHRYDTIAEGIGNDHVTANFGKALVDDAFRVTDQEAVYMAHYLLKHEGLFVGCSSAMNCVGAVLAARRLTSDTQRAKRIVTVLCDSGSRGVSRFWNREFIEKRGLRWPSPGDETLKDLDFIETR
ncbi:unnamed protein product [Scytosiphon promiscuus]